MLVYTLLLLLPLIALNLFLLRDFENRLAREQMDQARGAIGSARLFLLDYLVRLEPGSSIETRLNRPRLEWVGSVVEHQVNLYLAGRLYASSQEELYTAGLLTERIPGEIYSRLAFAGQKMGFRKRRAGDVDYLEFYAPVPLPGTAPSAAQLLPLGAAPRAGGGGRARPRQPAPAGGAGDHRPLPAAHRRRHPPGQELHHPDHGADRGHPADRRRRPLPRRHPPRAGALVARRRDRRDGPPDLRGAEEAGARKAGGREDRRQHHLRRRLSRSPAAGAAPQPGGGGPAGHRGRGARSARSLAADERAVRGGGFPPPRRRPTVAGDARTWSTTGRAASGR